jgi:hypothetical protein
VSDFSSESASALRDYQNQFVWYLREPDLAPPPAGVAAHRIAVYAGLLYNKIEDSLLACFPLTRELLGFEPWSALVRGFIAKHRCVSPLYRQIPDEFIDYLQNERTESSDPPLLIELAHYEWMELALSIAEDSADPGDFDPEGDLLMGVPVFAPVFALLQYNHPVHRLGLKQTLDDGGTAPGAAPFFILGFRDADDEVRFIEVSAATARLIDLLQASGLSGQAALTRMAEELRHPDSAGLLSFGADILRNLRGQGAILGTKPFMPTRPNRNKP